MKEKFSKYYLKNHHLFLLIQGPIPLRDNQMQSPDQFEDILRKMKSQQEQNKLQVQAKEIKDQKNLLEQREQVRRLMEKNSNKNFTYDYDGKIIISKKGSTKNIVNQENTVGISYKIGTTISVVKKINSDQPQQVVPKIIQSKDSQLTRKSISTMPSQISSHSDQRQAELQNQPSTYDMMLDNIKPSQGVVFKGSKGEIKSGEGFSNQQSQFDFFDTSKNPNDIKRMTKKDYEEFIKTSGNYSRHDTYKPRRYTTNPQSNINRLENNFEDILDGINYSQIQPIEEQTEDMHTQTKNRSSQNNILQSVSPIISQNKSSFKMAGINSIQRQSSDNNYNKKSIKNNQEYDIPPYGMQQYGSGSTTNKGSQLFKNSSQLQPTKKNKAGTIQVADQEKLRAMLLN